MAPLVQQTGVSLINDHDEFDPSEIDSNLLLSLLEEPHVEEECDDEKLISVIRSLEAEIDPIVIDSHDSVTELEWNVNWEDTQFSGDGLYMDNQNGSTSYDIDYNWMDVDDMSTLYYQGCGDGMDGIIEFGRVRDYSQITYGNTLEENGYGALWQETNTQLM